MQFGTPLSFLQSSLMQILSRNTTIINNYYYGGGRRGRGQGRDQVASIPDVADDPHQSGLMYLHVSEVSRGVVKTASNEEWLKFKLQPHWCSSWLETSQWEWFQRWTRAITMGARSKRARQLGVHLKLTTEWSMEAACSWQKVPIL